MQGAAQVLHGGNRPQPTLFPPEFLPPAPSQGEPGEQALPGYVFIYSCAGSLLLCVGFI